MHDTRLPHIGVAHCLAHVRRIYLLKERSFLAIPLVFEELFLGLSASHLFYIKKLQNLSNPKQMLAIYFPQIPPHKTRSCDSSHVTSEK